MQHRKTEIVIITKDLQRKLSKIKIYGTTTSLGQVATPKELRDGEYIHQR